MKHILYDMGIYFLWFTRIIFKAILNSLNNVSQRDLRGRGGHNWEKYFIGLFHVSEHVDHFKAIKYFCEKKREIVWSGGSLCFVEVYICFLLIFSCRKNQLLIDISLKFLTITWGSWIYWLNNITLLFCALKCKFTDL